MKKSFLLANLVLISLSSLVSVTISWDAQASPRQEFREGMREIRRERREATRDILNADSPSEARREIREGIREVQRERREMRREIRRELRQGF